MKNRQIVFASRPEGEPGPGTFADRETKVPAVGEGQILCRNLAASIDPYLRMKMYDRRSYTPPLQIGELIPGRTVAAVIQSNSPEFRPGEHVAITGGWQEYAVVDSGHARKVDLGAVSAGACLGPLGMTGMTAYAGLTQIGVPKSGETLVVSAAGGAVGSIVGQIGKIIGCRVVGLAGSDEKCQAVVDEFGFDVCVNYRDAGFADKLSAALPNGCDVYFDNVGGTVSRTVAQHLNDFARVSVCGLISQYDGQNDAEATAFDEFTRLILTRRLTVRGFIVSDIAAGSPEFHNVMTEWLRSGRIHHREHIFQGFEAFVPAFLGMLKGENVGKTIVQLSQEQRISSGTK